MKVWIKNYIEYIDLKNLSNNTKDAYIRDIENFEQFLIANKIDFREVEGVDFKKFIQELVALERSEASIARNIVSVRNFYKYLARNNVINNMDIIEYQIPKVNRTRPVILTSDEIDILLEAPDMNTNKGIRDRAMIELVYGTGMKISELLDIKVEHINVKLKYLICTASSGKQRVIPLGSCAEQFVLKYLGVRGNFKPMDEEYLFLNINGKKMTRQGFWKILKGYAKDAGIKKEININTLRHSFAVHMIENGADIKSIQEFLGYMDIGAAHIYFDIVTQKKLGEVYNRTHPRA